MANNTETVVDREPVQMETTTAEVVHAIESQPVQPQVSIQPAEETPTNSIVVSQPDPQSPTPTQTIIPSTNTTATPPTPPQKQKQ